MKYIKSLVFLFLMAIAAIPSFAQTPAAKEQREGMKTASERAQESAKIFNEMMSKPDSAIPANLLDKSKAIIIFPGAVQAALGIGGRGGRGIVSRRTANGWSEPAFFKMGGGSFGAQIGVQKVDYVLLVMNDGGLNGLLEDEFEIGGEVGAAAGPLGRSAAASTNATLDAEILSYSKSKGLYAGVALKGVKIYPDNELNNEVYKMDAKTILSDSQGKSVKSMPKEVQIVPMTLAKQSLVKK
jgi:lipid-binding SYLF domain-containing protein